MVVWVQQLLCVGCWSLRGNSSLQYCQNMQTQRWAWASLLHTSGTYKVIFTSLPPPYRPATNLPERCNWADWTLHTVQYDNAVLFLILPLDSAVLGLSELGSFSLSSAFFSADDTGLFVWNVFAPPGASESADETCRPSWEVPDWETDRKREREWENENTSIVHVLIALFHQTVRYSY